VKNYVVSTADWSTSIEITELDSVEATVFEASTRAVEWALENGKEVGIFVYLEDPEIKNKNFITLTYKVLANAGFHQLAEIQREIILEDFKIDIKDEPLNKLIHKIQKASLKKSFCIAKITQIQIEDRTTEIPVVCINYGLFDDKESAKEKCKELTKSAAKKLFVVKKMVYNF